MKLSIVIPHYKELEITLGQLLASIDNQLSVNFKEMEVIIVTDGGGTYVSPQYLSNFTNLNFKTLQTEQYHFKNVGPGLVRQIGLDEACGEYVMFCDADDVLFECLSLAKLLYATNESSDLIVSEWLEEDITDTPNDMRYIQKVRDTTWLHGKLFNRTFLKDNNIRFSDKLRVQEDTYFMKLVQGISDNVMSVPFITYVWKYNKNSITRKDYHKYVFTSFPTFFYANSLAIKELERRGKVEELGWYVADNLAYLYAVLNSPNWKNNRKYYKQTLKAFKKYYAPLYKYLNTLDNDVMSEVLDTVLKRTLNDEEELNHLLALSLWMKKEGIILERILTND